MTRKIAVVTGASKGIGAATAIAFGAVGYDVFVNYLNDTAAANKIVDTIKNGGGDAWAISADVFTEVGVKELFEAIKTHVTNIDVLVNNAGWADEPKLEDHTYETIVKNVTANFISAVMCTQAAIPIINKGGSILFNSSVYGMDYGSNPGLPIYSASKAAVANFTQTMAEILAPDIRCNAVAPGVTKTEAWDNASKEYIAMRLSQSLQKEWVRPEDIASAFVFLATNPHMTGQRIIVDGGWMKKIPPS